MSTNFQPPPEGFVPFNEEPTSISVRTGPFSQPQDVPVPPADNFLAPEKTIQVPSEQNLPTPTAHPKVKLEDYGILPKKPVTWQGVPLAQMSPEQTHHAQRLTAAVNDAETIGTLAGAVVGDVPEEAILDKLGPLAQGDSPEAQRLRTGAKVLRYAAQTEMTLLGLGQVLGAPETELAAAKGAYGDALQQAYRYSAEAQAVKMEAFRAYQVSGDETAVRQAAINARRLADLSNDWFAEAASRHADLEPLARVARFSKAVNNATGAAIAVPRAVEGLRDLKEGKKTDAAMELAQAALIGGGTLLSALRGDKIGELPEFSKWEFQSTAEAPAVADRFAHLPGQQRLMLASSTGTPVQDLKVEWPENMQTGKPVSIDGFHAGDSDKITPSARGTFFAPQATPEFGNQILKARVDLKNPLVATDGVSAAKQLGDEALAKRYENLLSGMNANGTEPLSSENLVDEGFHQADERLADLARRAGHDGIVLTEHDDLNPKQVMVIDHSAIKNLSRVGTFNWQTGNVMQVPSARDLGFYSALQQAVGSRLPAKASGEQALATLQNTPGVKDAELKWTGLDEFLKTHQSVTKDEIQDYLQNNELQIAEVRKGTRVPLQWSGSEPDAPGKSIESSDGEFRITRNLEPPHDFIVRLPSGTNVYASDFGKALRTANEYNPPSNVKFQQYTLPGPRENYREILLTTPGRQNAAELEKEHFDAESKFESFYDSLRRKYGENPVLEEKASKSEIAELNEIANRRDALFDKLQQAQNAEYQSPHWDEPNVLVHLRADDRTTADGKRALFVEEVQSDWAQAGKHEGFTNEPTPERLNPGWTVRRVQPDEVGDLREETGVDDIRPGMWVAENQGTFIPDVAPANLTMDQAEFELARGAREALGPENIVSHGAVPPMPFAKNWHELAMKRALRLAAEEGYDQLAWTTGAQQAERYDRSKQVSKVTYEKNEGDNYGQLNAYGPDGALVVEESIPPDDLEKYIGKEPARKLRGNLKSTGESPRGFKIYTSELRGVDLKIGGEWAKGLYDQMIPQFMNKLAKKFGGKVTAAKLGIPKPEVHQESNGFWWVYAHENRGPFSSKKDAEESAADLVKSDSGKVEVHSITITPEMREAVLGQGLPLFSKTGSAPATLLKKLVKGNGAISGQDAADGGKQGFLLPDGRVSVVPSGIGNHYQTLKDLGLEGKSLIEKNGLIRIAEGGKSFTIFARPTTQQLQTIARYVKNSDGEVSYDVFGDNGQNFHGRSETLGNLQRSIDKGFPLFSRTGQTPVGLNEEFSAVTKPATTEHLPIPPELLGPKQTPETVAAHELGHAVVAEMDGFLPDEVWSHQHPHAKVGNAAALTYIRFPQGWHQLSPLEQAKRVLPMLFAGGVSEELAGGPTFSDNEGIAGDMRKAEEFLQAANIPRELWAPFARQIHDLTRVRLLPHVEAIKEAAATREAGLAPELMVSREKLRGLLDDLGLSKFDAIPGHRAIGVKSGTGRSGWLVANGGYLPSGFSTHEAVAIKEGLGKNFKDALKNGNVRVKSMPGGATGFELSRGSQVGIERLRDHLATMPMTSKIVLDLHDAKGAVHTHYFDSPGDADQFLGESGGLGLPSSKIPAKLYHITHKDNVDSITKSGLKPSKDEILAGGLGDTKAVNLATRRSEVPVPQQPHQVKLEVDTSKLDRSKFKNIGDGWYRYEGKIPPEAVKPYLAKVGLGLPSSKDLGGTLNKQGKSMLTRLVRKYGPDVSVEDFLKHEDYYNNSLGGFIGASGRLLAPGWYHDEVVENVTGHRTEDDLYRFMHETKTIRLGGDIRGGTGNEIPVEITTAPTSEQIQAIAKLAKGLKAPIYYDLYNSEDHTIERGHGTVADFQRAVDKVWPGGLELASSTTPTWFNPGKKVSSPDVARGALWISPIGEVFKPEEDHQASVGIPITEDSPDRVFDRAADRVDKMVSKGWIRVSTNNEGNEASFITDSLDNNKFQRIKSVVRKWKGLKSLSIDADNSGGGNFTPEEILGIESWSSEPKLGKGRGLELPSSLKGATPADLDELSQFNKEEETVGPGDVAGSAADLLGAIGVSQHPQGTYVVRDDDGKLNGAMLLGHVGNDLEVIALAVNPDILEGKREVKGTGTQLLMKAAQVAAAEGKGLRLVSTSYGKGFYSKLGMIEYEPGLFKWTADEVKAVAEAAKGMSLLASKVSVSHGMRQVKTVLEGLPPEHLSAVKRVTGDEPGSARYYKGVIHLDAADYGGHDLDPADKATLLHEVGHAVYANLIPEKKKAWNDLSQNGTSSSLSEASNNNEHFAQIYADYAEEGAAGINKNEPKALNFIRGVFDEPSKFMKLPRGSEKAQVDVKGRARQRSEFKLTAPDASTGFSTGDRVKIKDPDRIYRSDSLRNAVGTVKGQADDGRIWVKWDGNTGIVPEWRAKELTNDQGTSEGNFEKGRRAGKKVSPSGREAAEEGLNLASSIKKIVDPFGALPKSLSNSLAIDEAGKVLSKLVSPEALKYLSSRVGKVTSGKDERGFAAYMPSTQTFIFDPSHLSRADTAFLAIHEFLHHAYNIYHHDQPRKFMNDWRGAVDEYLEKKENVPDARITINFDEWQAHRGTDYLTGKDQLTSFPKLKKLIDGMLDGIYLGVKTNSNLQKFRKNLYKAPKKSVAVEELPAKSGWGIRTMTDRGITYWTVYNTTTGAQSPGYSTKETALEMRKAIINEDPNLRKRAAKVLGGKK